MKITKYDSSRGWGQLTSGQPDVTSSKGFFKKKMENSSYLNFDDRVDSILRVYPKQSSKKKVHKILQTPDEQLVD